MLSLFPYTTLFRSHGLVYAQGRGDVLAHVLVQAQPGEFLDDQAQRDQAQVTVDVLGAGRGVRFDGQGRIDAGGDVGVVRPQVQEGRQPTDVGEQVLDRDRKRAV